MPQELIDDELWSLIEPLLPKRASHPRTTRTSSAQTEGCSRRPGLQFRAAPAASARTRHHPLACQIGSSHGSGLGKTRWFIERSFAWLHEFRRPRIRYERYAHVHEACLSLACCLICWNKLETASD
ncbi:transposase [Burkholderia ubonensis]|nr:transposase [Burkholderia ubonensis]RQP35854.1 transposase [Burkholderia ubonensis]RQP39970.1 transposase [Burkholderia ubonensis]RQP53570.1 transposase [Burkholderia ubonensis]RQP59316.1 transposase [Burkholderia ubonensis]